MYIWFFWFFYSYLFRLFRQASVLPTPSPPVLFSWKLLFALIIFQSTAVLPYSLFPVCFVYQSLSIVFFTYVVCTSGPFPPVALGSLHYPLKNNLAMMDIAKEDVFHHALAAQGRLLKELEQMFPCRGPGVESNLMQLQALALQTN